MRRSVFAFGLVLAAALGVVGRGAVSAQDDPAVREVPVAVALAPTLEVTPEPVTLDLGYVDLGQGTNGFLHVATANTPKSLWCTVMVDNPDGWHIGPSPGVDQFAILANGIPLAADAVQLHGWMPPYGEDLINLTYQPPTVDTQGGGVPQGFRLRLEVRAPTMDPTPPAGMVDLDAPDGPAVYDGSNTAGIVLAANDGEQF